MPTFSVAPHANPGDDFTLAPRTADFPPDPPDKPIGKGKVDKNVEVDIDEQAGDYWVMVNGASIGVTVGQHDPKARADAKQRAQAQKDQDALTERNREEKEAMMFDKPDEVDHESQNRPPNPEDQPNELPIGDNTGTTRQPTGQDVPKTGPVRGKSKPKPKKA